MNVRIGNVHLLFISTDEHGISYGHHFVFRDDVQISTVNDGLRDHVCVKGSLDHREIKELGVVENDITKLSE